MASNPQHIHIVGICGVATSALAIAFQKKGWKVTGSDKGFFPPVSTELEKHKVSFYAGWHPENIGMPDVIMMGGVGTSPSNPEIMYAKEKNIPVFAYAEILEKYFIKKNSIVTAGTWGKTTSSSLLSFILIKAGMDPSYFTGGLSLSHDTGALSDSDWSVVEGDEYQVSISDKRPKFVYYSPTHLFLTSVSWDHADLYPTEADYFKVFEDLVARTNIIVACNDNEGVHRVLNGKKIVTYGKTLEADYYFHDVKATKAGLSFIITNKGVDYAISSPMLGRFNAENIAGAFAMACQIGIDAKVAVAAIQDFKGIKRRFEKRFEGDVTLLDCHAPTPEKAASVLESIREVYDKKIVAVYEPNIGGRQRSSARMYDNAFKNTDMIIIPHLTKVKVAEDAEEPMEGNELASTIAKTQPHSKYIEDDVELVKTIVSEAKNQGDVIVFLGSHGFRGMIEETLKSLK